MPRSAPTRPARASSAFIAIANPFGHALSLETPRADVTGRLRTFLDALQALVAAFVGGAPLPLVPTRVRHRKGGTYWLLGEPGADALVPGGLVTTTALHTETGELLAIYQAPDGQLFARPAAMFEGVVPTATGAERRFVAYPPEAPADRAAA